MWIFLLLFENAAAFHRQGHFSLPNVLGFPLIIMLAYGGVIFWLNGWLPETEGFLNDLRLSPLKNHKIYEGKLSCRMKISLCRREGSH